MSKDSKTERMSRGYDVFYNVGAGVNRASRGFKTLDHARAFARDQACLYYTIYSTTRDSIGFLVDTKIVERGGNLAKAP